MTSDLTTKAAEIRAGLVADWRKAMESVPEGPWLYRSLPHDDWGVVRQEDGSFLFQARAPYATDEEMAGHRSAKTDPWGTLARFLSRCSPAGIASLLAIIEQQAAELAEAWREADKRLATIDDLNADAGEWNRRATAAEPERDELLREKERLGDAHQKWWKERGGIGMACFGSGHDQERAFAKTDKEFAFAVANAISVLENGPAGLADANSKSPDPSSQSERIAVLEAENAKLKDLTGWAYDTLTEINVSNYDHDDVCGLNAASVEVILGLATVAEPRLCNADHALPAALAPLGEE